MLHSISRLKLYNEQVLLNKPNKFRSSQRKCSVKKVFLEILQISQKFRKIHRKTPVLESFFNKVAGLGFLRTPILKNICERPSSHRRCSTKKNMKNVLKNFVIFKEFLFYSSCRSSGLQFVNKKLQHRCFL